MRIIAHIDMDAFFAAVEERLRPHLRGRPIVVGADPASCRGVVSTANYPARAYGIHSAMPITRAWRLAQEARQRGEPEVAWIAPSEGRYGPVSRRIMEIVTRRVPVIEQTSVDEAYLDLSFLGSLSRAASFATRLKREIREAEGLTASFGIGSNKLIAKIASDLRKPDGLMVVSPGEVSDLLAPMSIRKIPGIGPKTEEVLAKWGIITIRDLRAQNLSDLTLLFGRGGQKIYLHARGVDERPLEPEAEAKSVGEQETFPQDTLDPTLLTSSLGSLARGVSAALRRGGFSGCHRIVLTVRFADFETVSRSVTLVAAITAASELEFEATRLFMPFLDSRENSRRRPIRLLGLRAERLTHRAL